jgi:hypothetical protein
VAKKGAKKGRRAAKQPAIQSSEDAAIVVPEVVGKPFEKGKSGNPGGRPKWTIECKELMQERTPEVLRKLLERINAKRINELARQRMIDTWLTYSLGHPPKTFLLAGHDGGPLNRGPIDLTRLDQDELEQFRRLALKAAPADPGADRA